MAGNRAEGPMPLRKREDGGEIGRSSRGAGVLPRAGGPHPPTPCPRSAGEGENGASVGGGGAFASASTAAGP